MNQFAVAPGLPGVLIMKCDTAEATSREETKLCRARQEVDDTGHTLRIWSMRNPQRYPHVGTVHQHVGETGQWPGHWRTEPVIGFPTQGFGNLGG